MKNDQLYKDAVSEEQALEELNKNAGTQFDPSLVKLFEEYKKEIIEGEMVFRYGSE